ncbi:MAG: 4,5-DOPA dioxygenase extradiol [Elusimicrobia bacterium]|nr:4,5-DOPA dioxygenase extradiol [Elusimicrobiota bacterium]
MNAIEETSFSLAWGKLGKELGRPKAVLCVSAHWLTQGSRVTAQKSPKTIHDFYGFPEALYHVRYPAPGDRALAVRVADLLGLSSDALTEDWGLDHGAWSVLVHLFPKADVPVVQLSLDPHASPMDHVKLAQQLAPLRAEGVLLLGSGNLVHNLGLLSGDPEAAPPAWATAFDRAVQESAIRGDLEALTRWESLTPDPRLACPSLDHYLPLLYVLALRHPGEPVSFPVQGFQHGTISMRSVRVG